MIYELVRNWGELADSFDEPCGAKANRCAIALNPR
jgi:hypothetical protein